MDLALPAEEAGPNAVLDPQRCVRWLRTLYERAIGGFYRLHLDPAHWRVRTGKRLNWSMQEPTSGIAAVFPSMVTDIVIDRHDPPQRLVIDTKFTGVYGRGWHREQTLRSGHVYQLYAYLRSQEGRDDPDAPWADAAAGLLLHPAIAVDVDESVTIQAHRLRFATVDLTASHAALKQRLLELLPQV
jgi:5-methylcytosine-specific restriction enzyme subunit McrC